MTDCGVALRVVTLNIRNGRADDGPNAWVHRRAWVPRYLRDLGADIVGLQEAFVDQVEEIGQALNGYACIGVGRDDGKSAGEFCPIYFRSDRFTATEQGTFWFSETPDTPGSQMPEASHPRICTWAFLTDAHSRRSLRVCNLHLDHASEVARTRSVAMLTERVGRWRNASPVLVMGDFNAGENSVSMRALLADPDACLRDTFRAVHPDAIGVATYHGFRGGVDAEKIDYILAAGDVRVLDAAILRDTVGGAYPSDHYAVMAELAMGG